MTIFGVMIDGREYVRDNGLLRPVINPAEIQACTTNIFA